MTSLALPSELSAADGERRRRLRVMRTVATCLLLLAAAVFLTTRDGQGWVAYVHAASEAAMVGAIADWFAVTALFKRPLGLPIPHTALVPRKKEQLGVSLQEFVSENFLRPEVVRERVVQADVAARLGRWLADDAHAARLVDEAAELAADVLVAIDPDDVEAILTETIIPRVAEEPLSPAIGELLAEIVREQAHHGLVDLVVHELGGWMDRHPERLVALVTERAPSWSPEWASRLIAERLVREARMWVEDVRADPHSSARRAVDLWLADLAEDLQHDPETVAAAERLKARLLTQPRTLATAVRLWDTLRHAIISALRDPQGLLRRRLREEVAHFGQRLQDDAALRDRVDRIARDVSSAIVERYGPEIATVISATVDRWDGRETARRIELHVGRDLQFIRINGTVVGGLVGVLIHAVTTLL
ncbi:DUF445 domain-containing protein [uncultured Aeromicrobium sp.]|uniref:DUF445 domain-containing protein n=1 Tax=uncultured Aeromicrobium sp. TaxID=337820 RepID=UPI0025D7DFDD|nr:DUF445 domain-containing protein [uncultured Aeromicrobium sp.]